MKPKKLNIKPIVVFMFALILGITTNTKAQCKLGDVYNNCMNLVSTGFTYVKTLNIEPDGFKKDSTTIEYTYLFSKGTTYLLTTCDNNPAGKKMVVNLFDNKKQKLATNYDPVTKKYFVAVVFPCSATGMYKLKYSFQNNEPNCGVSILAIKKN